MKIFFLILKEEIKKTRGKIILASIIFVLFLIIISGLFNYLLLLITFLIVFLVIKDSKNDNKKIISPWKREEINKNLQELNDKKDIIIEHIKTNNSDLEAKLKLDEINKEIELFKKENNI